ncbi:MAG: flagellar basal body-associated FliL family protein [Hyphomicrobium sp.]
MAKKSDANEAEASPVKSAGPGIVVAMLIAILTGGLGGGAFGYFMLGTTGQPEKKADASSVEHQTKDQAPVLALNTRFPRNAVEVPFTPIITSLGPDKKFNIRLDLSVIAVAGTKQETVLKSEFREDVIALLWGLTIKDIEGGRGFQNLRMLLDERVRARGQGTVLGVLINGLIVQ